MHLVKKKDTKKLIEYLLQENKDKNTALHFASNNGHEEIAIALLNVFSKKELKKLIEYLMKVNELKLTALQIASKCGHEEIVKLLSQKVANAIK